jgi:hypothetical protein
MIGMGPGRDRSDSSGALGLLRAVWSRRDARCLGAKQALEAGAAPAPARCPLQEARLAIHFRFGPYGPVRTGDDWLSAVPAAKQAAELGRDRHGQAAAERGHVAKDAVAHGSDEAGRGPLVRARSR